MNIRAPQQESEAQTAQTYLAGIGLDVSLGHALELIARIQGHTSAKALAVGAPRASPATLAADTAGEYTLVAPVKGGAWVTVENISVHISKGVDGVEVNLFAKDCHHEPLGEMALSYAEAKAVQDTADSDTEMKQLTFYPRRADTETRAGVFDFVEQDFPTSPSSSHLAPHM
jgi:hypothetical protein